MSVKASTARDGHEALVPHVTSVNISPEGGIPKLPVPRAYVGAENLESDGRAHEKHISPARAVSLIDEEILAQLRAEGYAVGPGAMGENLTVRGLHVQHLPPGARLRFSGGVEIELTDPRKPCFVLDHIHPRLKDAVVGRCGYLARVVVLGVICPGEEISVV